LLYSVVFIVERLAGVYCVHDGLYSVSHPKLCQFNGAGRSDVLYFAGFYFTRIVSHVYI
jgi:hypothetical protein